MTLIAGYIYRESVHIIADSAQTQIGDLSGLEDKEHGYSAFGEKIEVNNDTIVSGSAQKIININDSILVAFSGTVQEGKQIIEDIKIQHSYSSLSLSDFFSDFFHRILPTESHYVIGFIED